MPSPAAFVVNGQTFFDPHPRQLEIMDRLKGRILGQGDEPVNWFLYGNRGGGKSRMIRTLCHALAMAFPGFKYAIVRRNLPDLRKNHLIYVGPEMRKLGGDFNQTFGQANYSNGSFGFYAQCEEEKDVEKVVGAEVALLYVDEAPQIKWDYLRLMAPSLRVPDNEDGVAPPYRTICIYGGNPVGESIEEIWKYFIDKDVTPYEDEEYVPSDFEAIELHLKDNPSLNPKEYRRQFAGLPAHYRKAWIDGVRMDARTLFGVHKTIDEAVRKTHGGEDRPAPLPEAMLGRPYHYIQELPKIDGMHVQRVPWVQVYRTYDHGFHPDPAVCVWLAVYGRRIVAFHEETWFSTEAKPIAEKMRQTTLETTGREDAAMTTVDPTIDTKEGIVTVMDTLEMHGVPCEPSINDRVLYADAIHGLLGEEVEPGVPRFQIYEPGCPMLAKYLPKMRWDEKNERKMADHKFDHWIVALAYFAISSGVLSLTSKAESAQEPIWMQWIREGDGRRHRRGARV
jgi:hypothetical protein